MWRPGCGGQDVEARMWRPGCGGQDVEARMWSPGCGGLSSQWKLCQKGKSAEFLENVAKGAEKQSSFEGVRKVWIGGDWPGESAMAGGCVGSARPLGL